MDEPNPTIINTAMQLHAAADTKLLPREHLLAIMQGEHGVHVWSPFFKTDPAAAWFNHGKKTFYAVEVVGGARARTAAAFGLALAWVQETYGYAGPWAGNAHRNKVPEIVQKKFPIKKRKRP